MTEWNIETALNHHAGCSVYDDGACTCGFRARHEQVERSPLAPGQRAWGVFAEKMLKERDAAREEVARLRAEAKQADEEATNLANSDLATTEQVIRALRAENERLRKALAAVTDACVAEGTSDSVGPVNGRTVTNPMTTDEAAKELSAYLSDETYNREHVFSLLEKYGAIFGEGTAVLLIATAKDLLDEQ